MHVNPNLVAPLLRGIEAGEQLVGHQSAEATIALLVEGMEDLTAKLTPGPSGIVMGGLVHAKQLAYSQGVVGSYRAATEGCEVCGSLSDRHFDELCFK